MADFAVWAPQRNRVRVQLDGVTYPMTPDGAGWWRAELEAPAGARYAYLLDDDPTPLPDPRSLRQPDGVHGPSQLYDHATRYRLLADVKMFRNSGYTRGAEHRDITQAVLARDADRAVDLLCAHYRRTASLLRSSDGAEAEPAPVSAA